MSIDPIEYDMKFESDTEFIEAFLETVHLDYLSFEEPFSHNVTSMSKCIRQRWFKWFGIKRIIKEPEPIYQAWGWMGNAVEDHIIDLTKQAGIYRGDQVRVKQANPNISGAIDIVVQLPGGKYYPVEVKSAKAEAFHDTAEYVCQSCRGKLWKSAKFCKLCGYEGPTVQRILWNGSESKPQFDHYCQLQMYLYLVSNSGLPDRQGRPIIFDEGLLWYYNKNVGEMMVHRILYDELIIEWLLEKTKELDIFIKNNEVPPRMFNAQITRFGIGTKSDFQCRFCDYKYNCYEEEILKKNSRFFEKEVEENGN